MKTGQSLSKMSKPTALHTGAAGCKIETAVQGRSEKRCRGIDRRGGREARLARGGIREHDAFLGHEMRGPAGTERGGVSMAGGREGQSARKGNGVKRFRQIGAEMV